MNQHHFKIELNWTLKQKPNDFVGKFYTKNHIVNFSDKSSLELSAAKGFKGDPSLYKPEDLLLSSLASCHMMSYLYCCSIEKIEVLSYTDQAQAVLETFADGSGKITKVILNPIIKIANIEHKQRALDLHKKANQLCFIANSCNFEVLHNPIISDI